MLFESVESVEYSISLAGNDWLRINEKNITANDDLKRPQLFFH